MRFLKTRKAGLPSTHLSRNVALALGLAITVLGPAGAQRPGAAIDTDAYLKALEHKARMKPAEHLMKRVVPRGAATLLAGKNLVYTQNRWEPIGPTFMSPTVRNQQGPTDSYVTGRVNQVAWDNRRPGVLYAATASGGLWKSEDYGQNWTPLSDFNFPTLTTASVAVDPVNTRILYVGLGDFVGFGDFHGVGGFATTFTNAKATGIMKSVNGGKTFVNVGKEMRGFAVSSIVVDPENPRILVATTGRGTGNGGVWRSQDGGTTWANVTPAGAAGDWSGVSVYNAYNSPRSLGRRPYYATCLGNGVYRSDDRGATWTRVNVPLRHNIAGRPNGYVLRAAPSALDPNIVYVMDGNSASSDGRIFKGTRKILGGIDTYEWVDITGNYPTNDGIVNNWFRADYANAFLVTPVAIDFATTDLLLGATSTLSYSVAGGPTWADSAFAMGGGALTHIEQHDLRYNPFQPSEQLLANDGGVYGTTFDNNSTPAITFDGSLNATMTATEFNGAAFDPDNAQRMVGGTPTVGFALWRGGAWSATTPLGRSNIGNTAINPAFTNRQYAVGVGGEVFYTRDGWDTFQNVTPRDLGGAFNVPFLGTTDASVVNAWDGQGPSLFPPILVDPTEAIMYTQDFPNEAPVRFVQGSPAYTGRTFLWRHDPPGANFQSTADTDTPAIDGLWRQVGTQQLTTNGFITSIAVANRGNRIFAGTSDGQLWVTSSVGGIDSGRAVSNPLRLDSNLAAVWRNITVPTLPARPITSISVNPSNAGDILVTLGGTGTGHVFRCQDVTANNLVFTDQSGLADNSETNYTRLPDVPVYSLVRDYDDPLNTWYIATEIGVFTTTDKGSHWSDAGTPLRLPNVPVTALGISQRTGFLSVATYGRGAWRFDLKNLVETKTAPQLSVTYSMIRSGSKVFAVVNLVNAENTPSNPVGPAENVNITASAVTVGASTANTETPTPVDLTTIGVGKSKSTTLQFPGTIGPSGSSGILRIDYSYRFNDQTFTKSYFVRTRLP